MKKSTFHLAGAAIFAAMPSLSTADPTVSTMTPDDSQALTENEILSTEIIRLTRFKILDINGDSYLTRNEIPENASVLRSQFDTLDDNRDGHLSETEYAFFTPPE